MGRRTARLTAVFVFTAAIVACGSQPDTTVKTAAPISIPTSSYDATKQNLVDAQIARSLQQLHDAEVAAQAAQQAAQRHAAEVAAARRAAAARQPRQPTVHAASVGAASVSGLGACGGDLPPCFVKKRESKGDYRIWNGGCYAPIGWQGSRSPCGGSTASGAWQILRSTWAGFDEVQDAKARLLWAGGRGCTHWSAC
jgi:hypothetical protein